VGRYSDHKKLGIMYILYALCFLVVGGVEAMLIRSTGCTEQSFDWSAKLQQLFTMHGTTMIFLAAMPFVFASRIIWYH